MKQLSKILISVIPFSFLVLYLFLIPALINASDTCSPAANRIKNLQVADWPKAPIGDYVLTPDSRLPDLVGYFFGWGVGLGGLAVFIALIIAGIQYITSVADPGKLNDAKERIKSAVIGLALLLSSWAIFNLINPSLTTLDGSSITLNQDGSIPFLGRECQGGARELCCMMTDPGCDPSTLSPGTSCPLVLNPNCNPKYWACCQDNDTACLKKGLPFVRKRAGESCFESYECTTNRCAPRTPGSLDYICQEGTKSAGQPCTYDGECRGAPCANYNCYTGYCKAEATGMFCALKLPDGSSCDKNYDCQSNKCQCDTSVWEKKCAPNPLVCNMIFEQKDLGCDIVRFYELPDFGGRAIDFEAPWITYPTVTQGTNFTPSTPTDQNKRINADWSYWDAGGIYPMSYQAFAYQKNADGKVMLDNAGAPLLISCGETACGCTINRCLAKDASGCVQSTADDSGGRFAEYAYNTNISPRDMIGVKVKDPTKQNIGEKIFDKAGEIKGMGGQIICSLVELPWCR